MTDYVQIRGRKVAHRVRVYWFVPWTRRVATTACGLGIVIVADAGVTLYDEAPPPDVPLCKRCAVVGEEQS